MATLKISREDHGWMLREQLRLKDEEGEKPTLDEVFARMRQAYEERLGRTPDQDAIEQKDVPMLIAIKKYLETPTSDPVLSAAKDQLKNLHRSGPKKNSTK